MRVVSCGKVTSDERNYYQRSTVFGTGSVKRVKSTSTCYMLVDYRISVTLHVLHYTTEAVSLLLPSWTKGGR